jgi:stage II sporulation protein M
MGYASKLHSVFTRNKLLTGVIALAFFSIIIVSAAVAYIILVTTPELVQGFQSVIGSARSYIAIPPPKTNALYRTILLNNIGHFWNPERAWVWLPFVGAYSLGYELLLNAIVIGGVASFATVTRGASYTIAGLAPHGIVEIPAFILEFVGLARWHVTTTRAIYSKLSGRKVDRSVLIEGLKDTAALSLLSVVLFAVAAYVETFITPLFLGM